MAFKYNREQIATKLNEGNRNVESDREKLFHRRIGVELHLVTSIKRGLEKGSDVKEENIASALESPVLGYRRPDAIKTAKELIRAFVEPIRSFESRNFEKTDIIVKMALLIREDITPDIKHRLLAKFDKRVFKELSERFSIEKSSISVVDRIINESEKIDEKTMSTRYADYRIAFSASARDQFEEGYRTEGHNIDDYHFMANNLPKIKLNPFGPSNGSPSRGKFGSKVIKLGHVKYDVYHVGSDRGDVRAFYIVDNKKKEIYIYEIYRH